MYSPVASNVNYRVKPRPGPPPRGQKLLRKCAVVRREAGQRHLEMVRRQRDLRFKSPALERHPPGKDGRGDPGRRIRSRLSPTGHVAGRSALRQLGVAVEATHVLEVPLIAKK